MRLIVIERFWKCVPIREAGQCWLWKCGKCSDGYGNFKDGKFISAHRFSYELANGPIPKGLQVRHSCDTPSCVNPEHLLLGTVIDNMRDRSDRGRAASKSGELNGRSVLKAADIPLIKSMAEQGFLLREIAESFCVSIPTINKILLGKTWRD